MNEIMKQCVHYFFISLLVLGKNPVHQEYRADIIRDRPIIFGSEDPLNLKSPNHTTSRAFFLGLGPNFHSLKPLLRKSKKISPNLPKKFHLWNVFFLWQKKMEIFYGHFLWCTFVWQKRNEVLFLAILWGALKTKKKKWGALNLKNSSFFLSLIVF